MAETNPVVALGAGLTERQAREIYLQGQEAVVFALLTQAKMIGRAPPAADSVSPPPATPSGMVPVYTKPTVKPKRGKRPEGRRRG